MLGCVMQDTFLIKIRVCYVADMLHATGITGDPRYLLKGMSFFNWRSVILWFTDEVIEEILQMKLWRVLDNRYASLSLEWQVI